MNIVIVDFGLGNLSSVKRGFKRINIDSIVSDSLKEIKKADKLVLPGVGHFATAIDNIKNSGIIDALNNKVLINKSPVLGICLGMQLMGNISREGDVNGLGWLDAEIVRFEINDKRRYKVPHIGWNNTKIINSNNPYIRITAKDHFYFVHSYHMDCKDSRDVWMKSVYENEFVSAIKKDNIWGTQFHPEKSHSSGLKILKAFADL